MNEQKPMKNKFIRNLILYTILLLLSIITKIWEAVIIFIIIIVFQILFLKKHFNQYEPTVRSKIINIKESLKKQNEVKRKSNHQKELINIENTFDDYDIDKELNEKEGSINDLHTGEG